MTKIRKITVYSFDELSDTARQHALEKLYNINTNYEWWDSTFDDFKTIADLMGIGVKNIYFSGFSSQGDGACFSGDYRYKKGALSAVKDYAPLDKELHRIAKGFQDIQRRYFYQLSADISEPRGHYVHERSVTVDVEHYERYSMDIPIVIQDAIDELLRDMMRWLYKTLEEEYDWRTSEEQIIESIQANEYEFDSGGNLI